MIEIVLSGGDFGGEVVEVSESETHVRRKSETHEYVYRIDPKPKRGPQQAICCEVIELD